MQKLILTIALLGTIITASAQTKKDSVLTWNTTIATTPSLSKYTIAGNSALAPYAFIVTGNMPKPVMSISLKKDGKDNWNDWDTMLIKIDKNKIHWLNDSTAVYIK